MNARHNRTHGKYFVGGLSWDTTTETLTAYFQQFGELVDVVVMVRDGKPRGFGFVTFARPEALPSNFVQLQHFVDNKQVELKSALPEDEMPVQGHATSYGSMPMSQPVVKKVFVGGIAPFTTKASLDSYFCAFGAIEDSAVMLDGVGQPRGFAFVTYVSDDSVNLVLQQPHVLDGKMVEVKRAEARGSPSLGRPSFPPSFHQQKMISPVLQRRPMYNSLLSERPRPIRTQSSFAQPSVVAGCTENPHSLFSKIFVGGLSRTVSEETLFGYFSNYGAVVSCEVMRRDGISRGFGFVVFSQDSEAANALSVSYHLLDGKPVECKICQPKDAAPPGFPGGYAGPGHIAARGFQRGPSRGYAGRFQPY